MSLAEKLLLGCNTAVIGMGIVFLVLILLSIIISIQSKLVSVFFKGSDSKGQPDKSSGEEFRAVDKVGGSAAGNTVLAGVDDETAAAIMIIVSHHVNIPLNELKFKSIKAL